MSKSKTMLAAGAGALAGYLLDPQLGRTRRARLADQTKAGLRDQVESIKGRIEYSKGVGRGIAHKVTSPFRRPGPVDDATLANRIRSQAIGSWKREAGDPRKIEIDVTDGTTVLSGEVSSKKDRKLLVDLVSKVEGVDEIDDKLNVS
jgi:osmotically-inducible protein OsmY